MVLNGQRDLYFSRTNCGGGSLDKPGALVSLTMSLLLLIGQSRHFERTESTGSILNEVAVTVFEQRQAHD
uniref:Uncharacterized protein n=1 Tax=Oryza brachyantha TaxID=4533 RepID=J3L628_ORYBR